MPQFNKRRLNSKTLYILRRVGRVIGCYKQINNFANELTDRVPTDPYVDNAAEFPADYKLYYIFGQFERDEPTDYTQAGVVANMTGTLSIPWIYKSIIYQTVYFDPLLNGSRFIKDGAAVDDEGVLIHQRIKALAITPGTTT